MKIKAHKRTDKEKFQPADEEQQRLLEAGRALRDLGHFAKNILQTVGGAAEVLGIAIERGDAARIRQSGDLLTANLDRLRRLVMDLCEYSRPRSPVAAPCRLDDLLQKAVTSLPPGMESLAMNLHLQTAPDLPEARLDERQITDMIRHMLIHLLDASQDPQAKICVEICYLPGEKEFQILFSGPIPLPAMPQTLFEPAEYKSSRFRTGLNLPLALCTVEQHNGRIELERLDTGIVNFLVCLPNP